MLLFLFIAAGFAAYGPPASRDAYEAIADRILAEVREAGDVIGEEAAKLTPDFPSDVIVERCAPKRDRKIILSNGAVQHFGGYECVVEILPNAEPPYRMSGFFRRDGYGWVFYGTVQETIAPFPPAFNRREETGEWIAKPGSLIYDGDPNNPVNPDYNPYQDRFDQTSKDWDDPNY